MIAPGVTPGCPCPDSIAVLYGPSADTGTPLVTVGLFLRSRTHRQSPKRIGPGYVRVTQPQAPSELQSPRSALSPLSQLDHHVDVGAGLVPPFARAPTRWRSAV